MIGLLPPFTTASDVQIFIHAILWCCGSGRARHPPYQNMIALQAAWTSTPWCWRPRCCRAAGCSTRRCWRCSRWAATFGQCFQPFLAHFANHEQRPGSPRQVRDVIAAYRASFLNRPETSSIASAQTVRLQLDVGVPLTTIRDGRGAPVGQYQLTLVAGAAADGLDDILIGRASQGTFIFQRSPDTQRGLPKAPNSMYTDQAAAMSC